MPALSDLPQQTSFIEPEQADAAPSSVTVYSDGGCDPNPGPGGWAAILQLGTPEPGADSTPQAHGEVILLGGAPQSTNNRMELEAAIAALAYLQGRYGACAVELYTDSTYVRAGISEWVERWVANGWQTKGRKAVKNQDLWRRLYDLSQAHRVNWHWVKGHAGDPQNERVDRLAGQARARLAGTGSGEIASEPSPPPRPDSDATAVQISLAVSCPGGRGPGAWAAVVRRDETHEILSGHERETTSNLLGLQAATAALSAIAAPAQVSVQTTDEYLAKGASEWAIKWQQRGWITSAKKPVKHRGQWRALLRAAQRHHVSWQLVRGDARTADLDAAKQEAQRAASGG
jgi:ribonuclease HI